MPNFVSVLQEHEGELLAALAIVGATATVAVKHQQIHDYLANKGIIPQHHETTETIPDGHKFVEIK